VNVPAARASEQDFCAAFVNSLMALRARGCGRLQNFFTLVCYPEHHDTSDWLARLK